MSSGEFCPEARASKHLPALHTAVEGEMAAGHTVPHVPQLLLSVCGSTQVPLHVTRHWQVGAVPLHVPSAWQVRTAAPERAYFGEQE